MTQKNVKRAKFLHSWIYTSTIGFVLTAPLSCGQDIGRLTSSEMMEAPGAAKPVLLDPFVDEWGRILSIRPASGRAVPRYNKFGLLESLAYDNGYYDHYSYDESTETVEVVRIDPDGADSRVYTFNLMKRSVIVWDASTGEWEQHQFDIGEQTFQELFPQNSFDPASYTHFGDDLAAIDINMQNGCICQFGSSHANCRLAKNEQNCASVKCTYKGNQTDCVWRPRQCIEQPP